MLFKVCVLLCAIAGITIADPVIKAGQLPVVPRIVGGQNANNVQFPHQASIRVSVLGITAYLCGGSVITRRFILTSAQCTYATDLFPNQIDVVVGTNLMLSGGDTYRVSRSIRHANFNDTNLQNDIGLLETDRVMSMNDRVAMILIDNIGNIGGGVMATAVGWGTTTVGGVNAATTLQYIDMETITNEECATYIGESPLTVTASTLCANAGEGKGLCDGDGSTSLVSNDRLIGVASWMFTPCASALPDGFVRISSHATWIYEQIGGAEHNSAVSTTALYMNIFMATLISLYFGRK